MEEKIGLSQFAVEVKNAGGFIVKAIQENYQDPQFQKQLKAQREQEKETMLASLQKELYEKQVALIRQAVRANPELLDKASEHISSNFARSLLKNYETIQDAYEVGGMVTGELNGILAERYCADLVAPVVAMYEAEIERLGG